MSLIDDQNVILNVLMTQTIGILATGCDPDKSIRLRIMYFGVDKSLNCYLLSVKDSPKIKQLDSETVSFLVSKIEDPYDNSWEIEINGKASILTDKNDEKLALERLRGRNPFADVALEANITGNFVLIKLTPKIVRYRIFSDILKGLPPKVIEF